MKKSILGLFLTISLFLFACNSNSNKENNSNEANTENVADNKSYSDFNDFFSEFKKACLADDLKRVEELTQYGEEYGIEEGEIESSWDFWIDADTKKMFSEKNASDVQEMQDENGRNVKYLNFIFSSEELDEEGYPMYESSIAFFFQQFDGVWKFYKVEMAG